jgi:hypothetical protein
VQEAIRAHVNAGVPIPRACVAAGIPWNTCKDWLKRGKEGTEPYAAFALAMNQAKAQWAAGQVVRISTASDWRASAWLLERRLKEFRPPPQQTELTGKDGGPLNVRVSSMSDDELIDLMLKTQQAAGDSMGEGGGG